MEIGQLGFVVAWVSIIGTTLGAVFAAFAFLHREMRRGFDRVDARFVAVDEKFDRMEAKFDKKLDGLRAGTDEKFDRIDEKFDGLRAEVTAVQVSLARIEGHLGIGFPEPAGESPTAGDARTGGAAGSAARAGAEVA
ncbi:MAG: hypothetical protein OXI26_01235 [bacterium]|nr:hypothetical protein [bacterium]